MSRWHSYSGPYWDQGDDYPHLEMNLLLGEKPGVKTIRPYGERGPSVLTSVMEKDVHWNVVSIYREELIVEMLAICAICGIPEFQIEGIPPWVPGTGRPLREEQAPATMAP